MIIPLIGLQRLRLRNMTGFENYGRREDGDGRGERKGESAVGKPGECRTRGGKEGRRINEERRGDKKEENVGNGGLKWE